MHYFVDFQRVKLASQKQRKIRSSPKRQWQKSEERERGQRYKTQRRRDRSRQKSGVRKWLERQTSHYVGQSDRQIVMSACFFSPRGGSTAGRRTHLCVCILTFCPLVQINGGWNSSKCREVAEYYTTPPSVTHIQANWTLRDHCGIESINSKAEHCKCCTTANYSVSWQSGKFWNH